ncbi:MAG: 2-phosphosulfolactate phosphatase [Candidatus Eisenbacteria bacterium]|uniref:Probable 2-phosphosulfolactate phosphatase n=1 Tax=Eiseniibacteriota bacterium TaxID=2212470 RepID=A0A538T8K5_UNCEI|nr:MAG: 2-phosphosulfolactate phosphatase [Candidatus Eisenbacteria bacterium]
MKRIELCLLPSELERASLDAQVVLVDVLRSCTSIATALMNGAAKIIPVKTVEEATRLHETLDPKSTLLCGEREGRKVGGFALGNSPREFTRENVNGATLIFASTNASPLMAGPLGGRDQVLLGYVNLGAVLTAVSGVDADVTIVCAGRNGRFSLEDAACAGALIRRLADARGNLELNDAATVACDFDREHGWSPESILRRSEHGRYLIELGFEEDIPVCAAVDSVPVVPQLRKGRITASAPAVAEKR